MNYKNTIEHKLYIICLSLLPLLILLAFFLANNGISYLPPLFRTCVLLKTTGLSCPGCGITRAAISFINGNLIESLTYHPLISYFVFLYFAFLLSHTAAKITKYRYFTGMRFRNLYWILALALIAIVCILKNTIYR